MCLQVPDDLTSLLFRLLACQLANQREILKLLDPGREQVTGMLKISDNLFSEVITAIKKLKQDPSTHRETDPVSLAPEVKLETRSELCNTSSSNSTCVDVKRDLVESEGSDAATTSSKVPLQRTPPSHEPPTQSNTADNEKTVGVSTFKENQLPQRAVPGGFAASYEETVAASKEEQKLLGNVLLIRGVLEDAAVQPHGDEHQRAVLLLSPCAHLAKVTSAHRIGQERNILCVELDQPAARAVVDFFWANRDQFPLATMVVTPSRAPSLQRAVRRLYELQKILERRLPQLNARVVRGTCLLLRGTDYFTAFALIAPGLILSNGDAIPSSLLLDNPEHPVVIQQNDPLAHTYYKAHDHFVRVD